MADMTDLKSVAHKRRVGSSPTTPKYISKNMYVELAYKSPHPKYKHAALIYKDGMLIASANNLGNHHAEVRALEVAKLLGYRLDDTLTLISVRILKNGNLALAKPCIGCLFHIKMCTNIKDIRYSTNQQMIVRLGYEYRSKHR